MTYQEKLDKFLAKNARESFQSKTDFNELPLEMRMGSSTHHPDRRGGMSTSDIVLWVKFLDSDWFRPYGSFNMSQIKAMCDICKNDNQIISLMELLAAQK